MKQIALTVLWLALVAFGNVAGCKTGPQPVPTPQVDGAAPSTPCSRMCDHRQALKCPDGEPTPHGVPCWQVCENVQNSGVITLDLACLTAAPNCEVSCTTPRVTPPPAFGAGSGGATRP